MVRGAVVTVAVVTLVLLAGCSASSNTVTSTPTPDTVETQTATPTATPTPTPEGGFALNPWGKQIVKVAVAGESRANVQMSAVVKDAIEYWETDGSEYKDYDVTFEYTREQSEADIRVIVVEEITDCGTESPANTLGCADLLNSNSDINPPVYVRIIPGLTYESTLETVKHEFGHVVGKEHGEEPMPLMKARANVTRPEVPDADERDYPYRTSNVTIYAADQKYQDDIEAVAEYFNSPGNTPAPDNMTLTVIQSREDADIVVEAGNCEDLSSGSCARHWGTDYDGQGNLDWYTNTTITIDGLDSEVTSWHIGYWSAKALYGETFHPFEADQTRRERETWD